jgi:hypothetical protein
METLKRCHQVLDDIDSIFKGFASFSGSKNRDSKRLSLKDRMSWAFSKKQKVGELVNELERCKSTLGLIFANELVYRPPFCDAVKWDSLQMAEENQKALVERQAAAEERGKAVQERDGIRPSLSCLLVLATKKDKVLNWLSTRDFNAHHSTIGETHAENTGMWLLQELQQWFAGNGHRLVICQGPGKVFHLTD